MRIDSAFLEDRLGAWSTGGPFEVGGDGWVELNRRNVVFQSLEIGEDPVFTSGSNNTLQFESRPMWANLTEKGEGFVLVLDDGDTTGQEVFVAKELLYSHGIHRPIVTHEDGSDLEVRESEDGLGYWVDYHHFTAARYDPQDLLVLKRQGLLVTAFNGDKEFDPDTKDLFVEASNSMSSYELMFEVEWFEANMPHLGLKGYEWYEDEHNGDEFYVVELSSAETPTELHFMEYRPTDDWVFTNGNPDNLYLFPFNETAREELGPINIKVGQDAHGVDFKLDVHGANDFELLIAEEWINSVSDEHPVFERQETPWVPAGEEPLLGGGYILPGVVSSTYRIWDSVSGPLVPPEYEVVDAGVLRPVDGCAIRQLAVVQNGSLIHDGPACFTNEEVLDLMEGADQVHWRYNPIWGPDHISYSSAARMCAMVVEGTGSGEVNWVGSPCLEYKSTSGSPPSFLSDLCSTMSWGNWSDAAFCGNGLTRYQSAGMDLGVEDAKAEVMADVLFQNDAMMEGMNEIFANESIQGEWDWLDDVRGFLHALRLDEPCLNGGGLLTVDHSIPDQVCGRTLNEFSEGNQTVGVDPGLVQAGWDLLDDGNPCEASLEALVVLGRDPAGYCGSQLPLMREPVGQMLESVDWNQTCGDRGFLMVGFEDSSSSRVCAHAAPDPDQNLDHVLETSGIESQSICYVDQSATGFYNPGDPVYLAFSSCNGTVAEHDLRLHHATFDSGSKVSTGDSDFGASYLAAAEGPAFRYHDMDADGAPGPGDLFYLCIADMDSCGDVVGEGWLRVTPNGSHDAGSVVTTGEEIGLNVTDEGLNAVLGDHFRYLDVDDNGVFDGGDVVYWTTIGSTTNPSVGHVRLGALSDTGGFGEILESGMVDVEESTWYEVHSWYGCSSEISFLLDPADSLPAELCGESTLGLEGSLDHTSVSVTNWADQSSVCGVEEAPLMIVDHSHPTPSVVCAVVLSSEDQGWQDAWADVVEINPCEAAAWLSGKLKDGDSGDGGSVDTYKLCGEVFEDPNRSIETVFGIVNDCGGGDEPSIGFSSAAMYSVCGEDVDPPIGVDNPCGDQGLAVPSGFDDGDFDGKEVCGKPIPDVGELIAKLKEYAPDECALTGELLGEQSGSDDKTVCGIGPGDQDLDLDQVWEMIDDANPCASGTDFVVGFNVDDPFAMCGGIIGNALDEVEDNVPCDLQDTDGTEICGIDISDILVCDDSVSSYSPCIEYTLDNIQTMKTYFGMPGYFSSPGNPTDITAAAWFVGAPLVMIATGQACLPEVVCIQPFGLAGSYSIMADIQSFENGIVLDATSNDNSIGMEGAFSTQSTLDGSEQYVASLAGFFSIPELIPDAIDTENPFLGMVGEFLFGNPTMGHESQVHVGFADWLFSLGQDTTQIDPHGGALFNEEKIGWMASFVAEFEKDIPHPDPFRYFDHAGMVLDVDWVSPGSHPVNFAANMSSIADFSLGIEDMPRMLIDGQFFSIVEDDYNYWGVVWPGEQIIDNIHGSVNDYIFRLDDAPPKFVVDVEAYSEELIDYEWTDIDISVSQHDQDSTYFIPAPFLETGLLGDGSDIRANSVARMGFFLGLPALEVEVKNVLTEFEIEGGFSEVPGMGEEGYSGPLIPPFRADLVSQGILQTGEVFASDLFVDVPDKWSLHVKDIADLVIDLRKGENNELDVHFGEYGLIEATIFDFNEVEGQQLNFLFDARCARVTGNLYLEVFSDDVEYERASLYYHGFTNQTSGLVNVIFGESGLSSCASTKADSIAVKLVDQQGIESDVLVSENIDSVQVDFEFQDHLRLEGGEEDHWGSSDCEFGVYFQAGIDIVAPDGSFALDTQPLGIANVRLSMDRVYLMSIDLLSYQGPDYLYESFSGDKETKFAWANKKASDGIDFWTQFNSFLAICRTDRVMEFDVNYHETITGEPKDKVDLNVKKIMGCNEFYDARLDRDQDDNKSRCAGAIKFSTLYGTLGLNNP